MNKVAFFTGHRPSKLQCDYDGIKGSGQAIRLELRKAAIEAYEERDVREFLSGFALGVDQWAAEEVIHLRDNLGYTDIRLVACIPFVGQASKWPRDSRSKYTRLLSRCDDCITLKKRSPTSYAEAAKWLKERNSYMAARSDVCIAVWDGSKGGTSDAVYRANRMGIQIIRIDPRNIV